MKLNIRFAYDHEKERIKEIWDYCFTDKEPFVSWYFDEKYCPSNTLVADLGEGVVSNLQMLPYKLNFHGTPVDVSYIVGAATLPEARGMGLMENLLKEALKVMKERRHPITILLPFKYEFYKRYGWETCYYHKQYKLDINSLKPIIKRYGKMRPAEADKDIGVFREIYSGYISGRNGSIIRSDKDWKCILKDYSFEGGKAYILYNDGNPEGYIIYSIAEKTMNIHEMAYINMNACKALWGFVYSHAAQVHEVQWKAPADDLTQLLLLKPNQEVLFQPFVMARVVDVEYVLELIGETNSKADDMVFNIHDNMASWNNGIFSFKKGRIEKQEGIEADIICSINTFTQLAMGFLSPKEAYGLGLIHIGNENVLEKAMKFFKQTSNYINDYY